MSVQSVPQNDKTSSSGRDREPSPLPPPPSIVVDQTLNSIGYGPVQLILFIFAGLASMSYAFDVSVYEFIDLSVQSEWNLSSLQFAILPSVTGVSNIPGALFYTILSDRYGRVWPYALALANVGIFGLASAFSPNFISINFLRFVTSFGVTAVADLAYPMLIEYLPIGNRGKILVLVYLIQSTGTCICSGLAWWLIPKFPDNGWRYFIIATSIPSLIALVYRLVFYLESPRFLIARGKFVQAKKVLVRMAYLNRKKVDIPDLTSDKHLPPVKIRANETIKNSIGKLLTVFKPFYLRRTICLAIISILQTSAYSTSSIFIPKVLKTLDPDINPYFAIFIGLLGQFPGIVLMSIIIEWRGVGRLNSMRFFTILTVIFFLLLAFVRDYIATPVIMILLYFAMVPIIPALNTYISESYPTEIRGYAAALLDGIASFCTIFFPLLGGYLASVSILWLFPTVFAGMYAGLFVVSLFLNYETLGTNLKDNV